MQLSSLRMILFLLFGVVYALSLPLWIFKFMVFLENKRYSGYALVSAIIAPVAIGFTLILTVTGALSR